MKIPGYQIEGEIGHGGMATVYQAVQTSLERTVALKVMAPALAADATFGERFQKEAKTVARLTHPNILAIHDIGAVGPYNYIAMEYVSGGDLKECIRRGLPPDQALEVIRQVADALEHAHKQGVVHRDIKPENILFREDGTVVLTDFGIAKSVDATTQMTATGMSIGTPRYMSPEQAQGKAGLDGRSDLYSLGVVLFEALTGKAPFDAETPVGIALKHVQADIPKLPPALVKYQPLIDRLMAKTPSERYHTGSQLIADIVRVQSGKKPSRPAAGRHPEAKPKSGGLKWLALALVLAAIAAAGIYLAMRTPEREAAHVSADREDKQRFDVPRAAVPSPPPPAAAPSPQAAAAPPAETPPSVTAAQKAAQKQTAIRQLLASAHNDLAALRLTSPQGNNAAEKYRRVLTLDADNTAAQQGLVRIVEKYVTLCDEAVSTLSFDRADEYLDSAAQFNLKSDQITAARRRVAAARDAHARKALIAQRPASAPPPKAEPTGRPNHGDRFSNTMGMTFVYIAPGSFTMGSPKNEAGRNRDETRHKVTLSKGYWLQTTEVTQAQWAALMDGNPSHFKGIDLPVEGVSWKDVQQFIQKLNQKQGPQFTVRLPSEAEWEYAARAGTTTAFAFGKCLSTTQANYIGSAPLKDCKKEGYLKKTAPTGSLVPNNWGFFDMHGNVHEWCQDWLAPYPRKDAIDPSGPAKGRYKVIRGGSWRKGAADCRSAARYRYGPKRRSSSVGFRLAGDRVSP